MNILHLLSQNHLTGAEVYAASLAGVQLAEGHRVFLISNGFFYGNYNPQLVRVNREVETRSRLRFWQNVFWLRGYLKQQGIQVVHTHSRAAAKLGYWATLGTRAALVSTVHGVQHPSFSKKLHNQYGRFIIAVCENIKQQLRRDFGYPARAIKVIPNGIDPAQFRPRPRRAPGPQPKIAIVGRTTGPKGTRTELVLQALHAAPETYEVTLMGGTLRSLNLPDEVKSGVHEANHPVLNSDIYGAFDLVIGSGRVCMESLLANVPTIAFGEACYEGPVADANFEAALTSNFGDIHPGSKTPKLDAARLLADIRHALARPDVPAEKAAAAFSLVAVARRVQRVYESAVFLKKVPHWIPVLMYHKVPEKEIASQHKIFVTKANFEKHLQFFRRRGFETLTFADLEDFRRGRRDYKDFPRRPLILTFDDGYRDNLENASPLLQKYNFKAQLFLLADPTVRDNHWDASATEPAHEIISGAERQSWRGSAFEIGSHGFRHQKITELTPAEARRELTDSKAALEKEFGRPVNVYAFTYGAVDGHSPRLAEEAGYSYAVNTDSGGLLLEEDPYAIFRVNIFPDESVWSLYKKTAPWYRRYYRRKRGR